MRTVQVLKHAIAHRGVRTLIRESASEVDSGRKIRCGTGELNLHQLHASPVVYQLSYIPTQLPSFCCLIVTFMKTEQKTMAFVMHIVYTPVTHGTSVFHHIKINH